MIPDLFTRLILPFLLGVAVGFERSATDLVKTHKTGKESHNVGIRTFSLVSTLGALTGIILAHQLWLALVVSGGVLALILLYYVLQGVKAGDTGITTELALMFTFLTGLILSLGFMPPALVIASTVVLILLLSRKQQIERFILGLAPNEVSAFISYALIALVILPFLPNRYFTPADIQGLLAVLATYGIDASRFSDLEILNPYRLWFIVALVTGVDLVGHLIERFSGLSRGRLLAGFLGGFVSSTAATQSLAQESAGSTKTNILVAAAVFANMASFFQLFVLLAGTNAAFMVTATPLILLLIISSGAAALVYSLGKDGAQKKSVSAIAHKQSEIISIGPALKFALLFVAVRLVSKVALELFGEAGFLASSALAALTGIDAVVINVAEMTGRSIDARLGIMTIILVNAVNLTAKSVYSYLQGSRAFAWKFAKSMTVIILASLISLLFL